MDKLFLGVLNMSITASYVILFVVIVRLFLKKAPKILSYALWGVVFFRLICPFSFESVFSLLPANPTTIINNASSHQSFQIDSITQTVSENLPSTITSSANTSHSIFFTLSVIWLIGVAALVIYSIISALKLKRSLSSSLPKINNIYEAENLKTPFVLGMINPKIYIPSRLSQMERSCIIRHEQIHIKRFDYIIKPLAFLVVCVHWFNPLVWLAFFLMGTDMELSCDERVIKEMGSEIKKDYSTLLLSLSMNRRIINGSPLAFGESNIKGRIKNVLNYKKSLFWVVIAAVLIVVVISVGLLANPKKQVVSSQDIKDSYNFYVMTANDNAPIGCEYGRTSNVSDEQILSELDKLRGFIFKQGYTSDLEFHFNEEKANVLSVVVKEGGTNNIILQSAIKDGIILVNDEAGVYDYYAQLEWPNGKRETIYFRVTVKSDTLQISSNSIPFFLTATGKHLSQNLPNDLVKERNLEFITYILKWNDEPISEYKSYSEVFDEQFKKADGIPQSVANGTMVSMNFGSYPPKTVIVKRDINGMLEDINVKNNYITLIYDGKNKTEYYVIDCKWENENHIMYAFAVRYL